MDELKTAMADVLVGRDTPRVLVVEDDPVSAMLIRKLLTAEGIPSDLATNGKLAVDLHRDNAYRLVVSDWMMPEMSGIELCRALRKSESNYLYFVLCSAKGERADRMEAFEAGVDDFLRKPLDKDDLRSRLKVARRVLGAEDKLNLQKRELERASDSLEEMNANLVMASRRFAELFNGLPVACFTFDESGLIHEWNRSAESLFGVPSYRAFQQRVWDVLGREGNDFWTSDRVSAILESGGQTSSDWTYRADDGSARHFACNVFALRNQGGELVGAISANLDVTKRFEAEQRIQEQMAQINEFAKVLEIQKKALEEANRQLSLRADTDGLTNVLNHRRMQSDLEIRFQEAAENRLQLSVILMDVDRFKAYNDNFGHQAGDDVLKKFAHVLKRFSREGEAVARYGGEEFAVILSGCGHENAIAAAERFRLAIESETWENRPITASFGVSTLDDGVKDPRELISRADTALYYSKENGRNRVTHFCELPEDYQRGSNTPKAA